MHDKPGNRQSAPFQGSDRRCCRRCRRLFSGRPDRRARRSYGKDCRRRHWCRGGRRHWRLYGFTGKETARGIRSEEHTSELQSLMRISYAVFCLKKTIKRIMYSKETVETHTILENTYVLII